MNKVFAFFLQYTTSQNCLVKSREMSFHVQQESLTSVVRRGANFRLNSTSFFEPHNGLQRNFLNSPELESLQSPRYAALKGHKEFLRNFLNIFGPFWAKHDLVAVWADRSQTDGYLGPLDPEKASSGGTLRGEDPQPALCSVCQTSLT